MTQADYDTRRKAVPTYIVKQSPTAHRLLYTHKSLPVDKQTSAVSQNTTIKNYG